ncbi:hypothetical protein BJ878DRAFT_494004 [Calycina marina]|uniref:Uncharacterized protein n=1 Tax=Calycina marina TaxID=1763456 RepID=A0A9P7Z869_9HELO|nr:hypothetical protein BJ878DRAFT_494004 [Calycina marina]
MGYYRSAFGKKCADPQTEKSQLCFETGLDNISAYPSPHAYRDKVYEQLLLWEEKYPNYKQITTLLLGGESTANSHLLDVLQKALETLSAYSSRSDNQAASQTVNMLMKHEFVDPSSAASRGAVIYATQRQEVQFRCVEDAECEEKRKRERHRQRKSGL